MVEKIKKFYDMRLYSKEQVRAFVVKGKITPEEYELITDESYDG